MVRAMILRPGELAEVREIELNDLTGLIGGKLKFSKPFRDVIVASNDDNGKMELNRVVRGKRGDIIGFYAGPMVILGRAPCGEIMPLTDRQVICLLMEFGDPDVFRDEDIEEMF